MVKYPHINLGDSEPSEAETELLTKLFTAVNEAPDEARVGAIVSFVLTMVSSSNCPWEFFQHIGEVVCSNLPAAIELQANMPKLH